MSRSAAELLMTAGLILAGLSLLAWSLSAWAGRRARRARESGLYPPPGSGTDADVGRLLDAGEKTLAIKLYRELYRVDLKSAKAAVEELARTGRRGG
jgi:hypothetical protein